MNQREALVTVLEFIGEQPGADSRELRQAVKLLTKRAEVLRVRYERRHATIPEDIVEEPVAYRDQDMLAVFRSGPCGGCGRPKPLNYWFCERCFDKLDPQLRKALRGVTCDFWPQAFCRAMRLLKLTQSRQDAKGEA